MWLMPPHMVGVRVVGCEAGLVRVLVGGISEGNVAGVDRDLGAEREDVLPTCESA